MILRRLMGGSGTLTGGVIPPSLDGYDPALAPYPYDTTRARAASSRSRLRQRRRRRALYIAERAIPAHRRHDPGVSRARRHPRQARAARRIVHARSRAQRQDRHGAERLVRRLSRRREFSVSAAPQREPRRRRQRFVLQERGVSIRSCRWRGASRTTRRASRCTSRPTRWRTNRRRCCFSSFRPKCTPCSHGSRDTSYHRYSPASDGTACRSSAPRRA